MPRLKSVPARAALTGAAVEDRAGSGRAAEVRGWRRARRRALSGREALGGGRSLRRGRAGPGPRRGIVAAGAAIAVHLRDQAPRDVDRQREEDGGLAIVGDLGQGLQVPKLEPALFRADDAGGFGEALGGGKLTGGVDQ